MSRQKAASNSRSAASTCRSRRCASPGGACARRRWKRARSRAASAGTASGRARRTTSPATSTSAMGRSTSATSHVDMPDASDCTGTPAARQERSHEDAVVEGGEEVVGVLERGQAEVVHRAALDLRAQLLAAEQVIQAPSHGVLDGGRARHHEGPVTRLREEELAQRLGERAARALVSARVAPTERVETVRGGVEVAVEPVVLAREPDFVVALPAPGGGGRRGALHGRVAGEVVARGPGAQLGWGGEAAEHRLEPPRAPAPPVPEEPGAVGADDDRRPGPGARPPRRPGAAARGGG